MMRSKCFLGSSLFLFWFGLFYFISLLPPLSRKPLLPHLQGICFTQRAPGNKNKKKKKKQKTRLRLAGAGARASPRPSLRRDRGLRPRCRGCGPGGAGGRARAGAALLGWRVEEEDGSVPHLLVSWAGPCRAQMQALFSRGIFSSSSRAKRARWQSKCRRGYSCAHVCVQDQTFEGFGECLNCGTWENSLAKSCSSMDVIKVKKLLHGLNNSKRRAKFMLHSMTSLKEICRGLPLYPLPENRGRRKGIPHAPVRTPNLTAQEKKLALRNALRYFPPEIQKKLALEFAEELRLYGHIYMYRFFPDIEMRAYPIGDYPCKTKSAAAIMLMIMNNLDPSVAQFPQELVTYGGNGQVFSNWAQFWLVMHYLSEITEEQTLVMYSGHPLGVFPSHQYAPRLIITNGMVIPNYSTRDEYEKMFALGVTMYGQMTAGSYCYIGPQGIVHGTVLTVLNAGRRYLKAEDLSGKVFVTSGLGGMSGAQAKAAVIAGCVGIIAEVDEAALLKRHKQGWLMEISNNLDHCIAYLRDARKNKIALSLGYHGNVVDLWERLVYELDTTGELLVDLGSDQTSCHNPFSGGYYPVQLGFEEAKQLLSTNPGKFRTLVQESLKRHVAAINKLADKGMFFWDYGNAFLLEAQRAGADVEKRGANKTEFRYPSYVQHIMGDIFSLGFGPFRWVCTSGDPQDLATTDSIAMSVLEDSIRQGVSTSVKQQYHDNIRWIREAGRHSLVVGSQARILYSDQKGRVSIAVAINRAISEGRIKAPVVLSRDHHDVSGTDSPYRETSNIYDGSAFCADMAVQNFVGDAFRGATWVALHNGGGVGWGEVINGGFGLVLDGSKEAEERAKMMLSWDVSNGVARRCWSGNDYAYETICQAMKENATLKVTLPHKVVDENILEQAMKH
ncbi:urocanate hydratase isoform X2 [Tyto alba]|uniref:urocanate hydratase isoform X2 n=1 Tax=Tyto alba TaxID=56313 RepID=UPI001C679C88|nr:urocanate hydratase isoform X2 [Tyto alba]